jgi:hypothetical protein
LHVKLAYKPASSKLATHTSQSSFIIAKAMTDSEKPEQSKVVQMTALAAIIVGVVVWQAVGRNVIPDNPGGGFNWPRVLMSALVGGVCGGIGAGLGMAIDKLLKR